MVKRRAADAAVSDKISCHTFRATGITNYLHNKGKLEFAQKLASQKRLEPKFCVERVLGTPRDI